MWIDDVSSLVLIEAIAMEEIILNATHPLDTLPSEELSENK